MNQQLFEKGNPPGPRSLTITKAGRHKLSKHQEAFNKLTQKIAKLQKDIETKQWQFDLALNIYGNELHTVQLRVMETRHKLITVLWGIYKSNKLSRANQRHLKNVLQHHLEQYFAQSETGPDEVLQNIFSEIEGISYDKMMQEEKEKRTVQMREMFEKMNVDIKGVDLHDAAAMAEKMAEAKQKIAAMQEQEEERRRQQQGKKNKTAKQAKFEKTQRAMEEMKQKNISTIYRQLAKLFHPDLEQDAEKKMEKEILMKALTNAYEAKNLHALLTLELNWIHKETDHLESLTEEKLAIYLQILKEQAQDLTSEKNNIFKQPQYSTLANLFGYSIQQYPVEMVKRQVEIATETARNFENDIADFESDLALRHVNEMIKQWKQPGRESADEEILRMLLE